MRDENPRPSPAEQSSPEGVDGPQGREAAGRGAGAADPETTAEGVLTLVCFKCGREYHFDEETPPDDLTCEKCGGTVFRSFFSPDPADEAARDFADSTERDHATDQPSTDTMPGDVLDLNRG